MFDLTGRVALVTGAGQGMGVGIARALLRQGAAVIVNDLVPERAEQAAGRLGDEVGPGAIVVAAPFDITDAGAVEAGVGSAEAELGRPVDILVNNAGVPDGMDLAPFRELDPDRWRRYIDLNVYGSMHCIRTVIDGMCERRHGRVVQISSAAGRHGIPLGISLYGASKSGIEGFIRHLAAEVGRDRVTANIVALGMMDNAFPVEEGSDLHRKLTRGNAIRRLGTPDDVGAAVVYLASDEASWMTGQTLDLNGGAT